MNNCKEGFDKAIDEWNVLFDGCSRADAYAVWQSAWNARVPEGYVVVPREPTEKMIDAAYNSHCGYGISLIEIYQEMIAAAEEEE